MSTFFWNLFAKRYSRQAIGDPATYAQKLAKTAACLTPETRLLEIGCGTGSTALTHAPRVASVLALDYSSKMIDIATAKAAGAGVKNVNFSVGTLDDLAAPAPDQAFDVALALSFLHLVPDVPKALAQLWDQLKPGGMLFSSTACVGEMTGPLVRLLPRLGATRLLPKVTMLTEAEIERLHREAGFEIIEKYRPQGHDSVFLICRKAD